MKKILLLAVCFCAAMLLNAQKADEGSVMIDKVSQPCFMVNIPSTEVDFVENALKYVFEDKNSMKGASSSGFRVYKRQRFVPFGADGYDIYFKVEQNGPKKNREVKVIFLVSKDAMSFVSGASDAATASCITRFLDDFVKTTIPEYTTVVRVSELSAELKKLEDKKSDLTKKQEKLNKELLDVQEQLKENAANISKAQQELNMLNQK